jgi:hypothetical protein
MFSPIFLILPILVSVCYYLTVVLICISLMTHYQNHVYLGIGHLVNYSWEVPVQVFCPFFLTELSAFFLLFCTNALHVLESFDDTGTIWGVKVES